MRSKVIIRYTVILLLLICANGVAAQKDVITRVFVLRHAEKADNGTKDPPLSAAGRSRALALATLLSKTPVDAIYSTPYKRTRETAGILSTQKRIAVEEYNPADTQAVKGLVSKQKGKSIVFVGHSNTVPLILNTLTQSTEHKDLPEDEFDNLWILLLKGDEPVDLLQIKY